MKKHYFLLGAFLFATLAMPNPVNAQTTSTLTVSQGIPNPNGTLDELYLLKGSNIQGDIVISDENNILPEKAENADNSLYIYHINDMHGNIMKYSSKGDTHSLAQMKQHVDSAKNEVNEESSVIWVTAGDDHIGSKLDELLGTDEETFIKSASYEAYSYAGIDFGTLGNHEFDKYTPILGKAVNESAKFPIISSNIFGSQYDLGTSVAAIGVTDGLRIGVIGLTIPEETPLTSHLDPNVYAEDPLTAVEKLVPEIAPLCDLVLVISHNGYEKSDRYTLEDGEGAIANMVSTLTDKPAVVVGGHTHTVINVDGLEEENVYGGVPVVQAGQYGAYIGKLYANISEETPVYNARLLPILSGVPTTDGTPFETEESYDVEFQTSVIDPMNALVEDVMSKPIGTTDSSPLLSKDINIIDRYTGESAMANFFNDAIVKRSEIFAAEKVDFSIFNSTGIGGLELDSEITYNDMYNLFPYADTISNVTMTGLDLKEIIENNAPRVIAEENLIQNGGTLDATGFIETGYLNFSSGIRYKIQDGKAIDITLNGENIDNLLNEEYNVAISTYLVIGRGGWHGAAVGQGLSEDFIGYDLKTLCAENGTDLGVLFRGEIINYIIEDCNGLISSETGVIKDGRVEILN